MCLADSHGGLPRVEAAGGVVGILLRHRVGLAEVGVPIGRDLRQPRVGVRRREVGAGLLQLLLELGGVDLGEQLAGFHPGAQLDEPPLEVSAGPRVDRRIDLRLHRSRQDNLLGRRAGLGRDDRDGRDRQLGGLARQLGHGLRPVVDAPERHRDKYESADEHEADDPHGTSDPAPV